jgi:hypothetical protein
MPSRHLVGVDGSGCSVVVGDSTMLGNFEREGRAEIGGEGSEINELVADIANGLRISGTELDGTEGQPNKLVEDFCFVGVLKDVGVPGREMGCSLGGGGCWGIVLAWEVPEGAEGLNPSAMVGWRSRGRCLVDRFKDGADWLVVKLTGGLLELESEVCGDMLIGGRIGRVGVVVADVEPLGKGEDELKVFIVDFVSVCTDVVDDGVPEACPGEKAVTLGLSIDAEA